MHLAEQSMCAALPSVNGIAIVASEMFDISYNHVSGQWLNLSGPVLLQLKLDFNNIT